MSKTDPIRPTDDEARALARDLIATASFGALGVLDPQTATPLVSRIAVALDESGQPMTLISDLAMHSRALQANPACSLLVGEPGPKGDPLTHPRLTLQCTAQFIDQTSTTHASLREFYLTQHPKAKLYIDFKDFRLVRLQVTNGFLNGGFGKAYHLTASDLS